MLDMTRYDSTDLVYFYILKIYFLKKLIDTFPNKKPLKYNRYYQWRREEALAGAPTPAKKCPSLVNI
jgi:hypothetical protein